MFIIKKDLHRKPQKRNVASSVNKEIKVEDMLTTQEKIKAASEAVGNNKNVKKIKGSNELIERVESEKTILTEDNRELLKD